MTATRGERGRFGESGERPSPFVVGHVREAELREAARVLGVREVRFLDYYDGDLDQDVKTPPSNRQMHVDTAMLQALKDWNQLTEFSAANDFMFASPWQIGRLPISYSGVWRALRAAAGKAGIGHISSHTFRHTHRSWLDAVGTPLGVQQELMRHADIRTTMNIYGNAATADMQLAHGKVVRLALT